MDIRYNPRAGRYIGIDGRFVSAADIQLLITGEQTRLNAQLQELLDQLFAGDISVEELQLGAARLIKDAQLRVTTLAAGGEQSLNNNPSRSRFFGQTGAHLKREYQVLLSNGQRIVEGELSEAQIRDRFRRQSIRLNEGFFRSEMLTRITQQGHNEARRFLSPTVNHCPSCPGYQVQEWSEIGSVVPRGTACECGGYCYCVVQTRFNPDRAIAQLQGGGFADAVNRLEERQNEVLGGQN